ncbi:TPA: response regulator transcription factor [Candidatus Avacholeplasma faecigallinarum]|nr:response regulator transcription factor [Candidatus Avacholeplasma faecigallinarum]
MSKNILIIEDDKDIIELLKIYLDANDFITYSTTNGLEAKDLIKKYNIDLLIVDIMMPNITGYEVIKLIRKDSNLPIIVVSAKILDSDKILGLNLGADAYITKPFNPMEVIAYINSIFRRNNSLNVNQESLIIKIKDLELNKSQKVLRKNNKVVPLTSYEYKIIEKLMSNAGCIFTKTQLYECISDDYFEGYDNTMMVHISNLRSKIEDDENKYIVTVRGLGYKIEKDTKN